MEFIDYYAALNLPKNATASDVQEAFEKYLEDPTPGRFDVCLNAYATLTNPYKRQRYDKTLGHLLVIQVNSFNYYNPFVIN
jgi:curved DNA-binding protein CbpA